MMDLPAQTMWKRWVAARLVRSNLLRQADPSEGGRHSGVFVGTTTTASIPSCCACSVDSSSPVQISEAPYSVVSMNLGSSKAHRHPFQLQSGQRNPAHCGTTITTSLLNWPSSSADLRRGSCARSASSFTRCRTTSSSTTLTALRFSHVTSFKEPGYYRFQRVRDVVIDPCVYDVRTMRGGGPGGQGTNSSSNKVELRVDLEMLSGFFDDDILRALRANEEGKALTADGTTLIVTCHEHRSALQNKEGCIVKVQEMLRQASWVPPVPSDPIERPSALITRHKLERRKKSNMQKMQRAARRGQW